MITSSSGNRLTAEQEAIYTLAQSRTKTKHAIPSIAMVSGQGTKISEKKILSNRARRKLITRAMMFALIDVAKSKGDLERVQAYWNTYHCQNKVIVSDGTVYSNYCKNRFCTVCCAIRKAHIVNKYYPIISQWEDVQFVTLTVQSKPARSLNKWMDGMVKAFRQINDRCKKRHRRGKGVKIMGVKSLECNFNPLKKTYNPHYHLLVPNREIAELLKIEWLKQWRYIKFANPKGQKIIRIDNIENGLIEIIKYGSKIFTEWDVKNKSKNIKKDPKIYALALDNIFVSMKGKRIFDRFGFNLPPQPVKETKTTLLEKFEEWYYDMIGNDWINPETGDCLSGYEQPTDLEYLLENCIDTELY